MRMLSGFIIIFLIASSAVYAADSDSRNKTGYYERELLALINQYRVTNRLQPLSFDKTTNSLAESHSTEMKSRDDLNHDKFDERFKKSGRSYCVENVGWNFHSPKEQFIAWQKSEGHNKNMLSPSIRKAGISRAGEYVTFFACD